MFQVVLTFIALGVALAALARALSDHLILHKKSQELNREIEEVKRVLKHRITLANEIAHEIKNPITAILCSADTLDLLIGNSLNEDNRKSLQYIREYGDSLLRLVSDFLDLGRAEAGDITTNPQAVNVLTELEAITGLLTPSALRKDISLKCYCSDPELEAHIDLVHFKQIIFNLLHNAIKFTRRNGEIKVVAEAEFPKPTLKLSIIDNGVGMTADQLTTLFDPYVRYNSRTSGVFYAERPGVGLGLALCKTLVELAGGTIQVQSELNVGSRFDIYVPVSTKARVESKDGALNADVTQHDYNRETPLLGQHFLIVNADMEASRAVAQLIGAWGGVADQVGEASAAVSAIASKDYDAVVIDDELSSNERVALVRLIREEDKENAPTVILAGHGQEAESAKIEGANHLDKPFNGKTLLSTLLQSGKTNTTH